MKYNKILFASLIAASVMSACSDDKMAVGNPQMNLKNEPTSAHFGDSIPFTVNAKDVDVPLSTLKAQLFFGEEMVEETVIRTKVSDVDYSGKIYVPYYANIPNGTATLKLVLQNIHFTITEEEYALPITHPDFPYLTLEAEDGNAYRMSKVAENEYAYTGKLPQKVKGLIKTPKVGENGNELVFGYENNQVKIGAESGIPFTNSKAGKYTISLNTYSFEAAPFVKLLINGQELENIDDTHAQIDLTLAKGQTITPADFPNFEEWWIDPDYFTLNDDGTLKFNAISGEYRLIADMDLQYFRVQVLKNGAPASLQDDGTGALWVIGADFGKPSISGNETGWNTDKAVCMAPIAEKVYQMTLVGGKTVKTTSTNFKFYGAALGWGNEFKCDRLSTSSALIGVGDGVDHDNGNLYLHDGVTLKDNVIYVFTVDMTAGVSNSVLTVTEAGEMPFEEKRVFIDGVKMNTNDNALYTLNAPVEQNSTHEIRGIAGLEEFYMDPDYFEYDADQDVIKFLPISGNYKITINRTKQTIAASMLNGDADATISDGGAIWLMGWGVGSPSLDGQFGWTPGAAYCMAQIAPGIYQFSGTAGPEKGSEIGARFRTDYLSFKFFGQNGWGFEFSGDKTLQLTEGAKAFIKNAGNFELADGVTLEEGAEYVMTIDITAGTTAGTLDFKKK